MNTLNRSSPLSHFFYPLFPLSTPTLSSPLTVFISQSPHVGLKWLIDIYLIKLILLHFINQLQQVILPVSQLDLQNNKSQ